MAIVTLQAAFAVKNAQLQDAELHRQSLERERDLARQVHTAFLPSAGPSVPGYQFFDSYEAVGQVTGDFYDYVPLPDGRTAVVLSDVGGRGMPAVLLSAKIGPDLRYRLAVNPNPAEALGHLNASLASQQWGDRFATLLLIVLDPVRHEATIVNAGHHTPYLRRAGSRIESVGENEKGLPLGVVESLDFEATRLSIAPGDALILYNDGILEAMDPGDKLYGSKRLLAQIERHGSADAATLGRAILDDIAKFRTARPQQDGQCLICIRRD